MAVAACAGLRERLILPVSFSPLNLFMAPSTETFVGQRENLFGQLGAGTQGVRGANEILEFAGTNYLGLC